MKKLLLIPACAALMAFTMSGETDNGCNGYWMVEKGVTLEYYDYNAKDKLQGSQTSTITELTTVEGVLNATIHSVTKDDKGKLTSEGDFGLTCKDGEITLDMKSMMDPSMTEEFKDMEVKIDQTDLVYPSTLTPGQTLPDGKLTMTVSTGGMTIMTMVVDVVDRKVEASESVTVPAGTFECIKMSQTNKMDMGMMKMTTKSIDWFTLGVGVVRSESYDKDGALESYRVLNKIIE